MEENLKDFEITETVVDSEPEMEDEGGTQFVKGALAASAVIGAGLAFKKWVLPKAKSVFEKAKDKVKSKKEEKEKTKDDEE